MAILITKEGKFAETNKATLQRLAKGKGDKIKFVPFQNYELVSLNGQLIGPLFSSHEAAITFLAKESSALKKTGMASAPFRRATAKVDAKRAKRRKR